MVGWSVVTGRMVGHVGFPAATKKEPSPTTSLIPVSLTLHCKVKRDRIFLYACRPDHGRRFFKALHVSESMYFYFLIVEFINTALLSVILHCIMSCGFNYNKNFLTKRLFWQNVEIMTKDEIARQAHCCKCFSHRRPALSSWLLQMKGVYDKLRLEAVGNIVIPQCVALPEQVMAAAHQDQFA